MGNSYSHSWQNSVYINHEQENPRDQPSHIVKIKKSSNLYKITKSEESLLILHIINCRYRKKYGKLFTEDGIIEGIENPNQKFV